MSELGYATRGMVKQRLGIAEAETSYDTVLDAYIVQADALIDTELKPYVAVPLTTVPQVIKDIAADWAAGLFHQDRFPGEKPILVNRAKEALSRYVAETYLKPRFTVTTSSEAPR